MSGAGDAKKSKLYNGINNVDQRQLPKKRDQEKENYVSSVRTVALCVSSIHFRFIVSLHFCRFFAQFMICVLQVSTAVAFGVGLGLKDGVGKASEFFAGYAQVYI